MKNFHKNGRDNGGFGNRPAMFRAVCAECGASCEVPFKPTGDRPVYCSNCFKSKDLGGANRFGSNDRSERREFSRPSFSGNHPANNASGVTKDQLEALHAKLDRILRAVEHFSVLGKGTGKEIVQEAVKEAKDFEKKVAAKVSSKVKSVKTAVSKAIAPKAAIVKKAIKKNKKK